jgi:Flp pilus assembly protein TadB
MKSKLIKLLQKIKHAITMVYGIILFLFFIGVLIYWASSLYQPNVIVDSLVILILTILALALFHDLRLKKHQSQTLKDLKQKEKLIEAYRSSYHFLLFSILLLLLYSLKLGAYGHGPLSTISIVVFFIGFPIFLIVLVREYLSERKLEKEKVEKIETIVQPSVARNIASISTILCLLLWLIVVSVFSIVWWVVILVVIAILILYFSVLALHRRIKPKGGGVKNG